ncbi:hypothetical protein ACS0TY_015409 [Phlomoides rotata]
MLIHKNPPHFVLLPFLAQGHLIPMVDIARLLASRGVVVTILLTPQNGNRVKSVIDRAIDSGLTIRVILLKIPLAAAGLPEEWDNFDMLPSLDYWMKLFTAISMLNEQVEELLQHLQPSPTCFIADMCYPWATNLAHKFHIPRLVFHGTSCFALLCIHLLATSKPLQDITSYTDYFEIPDIPDRIEITKAQMMGTTDEPTPEWLKIRKEMAEAEKQAFGTVANTFEELEPAYVQRYVEGRGKKVWCIGPVSLCNKDDSDKAERGNKASIDQHQCLKWLDSHEPSSVIYVCLGSLSRLSTSQLIELGLGLDASNLPFIWVIRNASDELKAWLLEDKFEERTNGRGLVIQGWAPQVLILSHPSVGAFVTHCGWNSTLEGVTAGLPLITWPVFADQFCNEKFIVNVIKTGVRVGVEVPVMIGQEESVGVQVKSEDVKMVIEKVMDAGGEGARERRERARKLGEMAERAVEEGGSSNLNMTQLIQDVIEQQAKHDDQSANLTKLDEANSSEIVVQ